MTEVQYFKAQMETHRFNANQKVWVRARLANHLLLWFKWRGKGRYVTGIADRFAPYVGELHTIEVDDEFAGRIHGS